MEILKMSWPY